MTQQSQTTSGGTSLATVLFVVFLVLKLTKTITWSWWWVTAPLWIPVAFAVLVMVIFGIIMVIFGRER